MFKLSTMSNKKMAGVDPRLIKVVRRAIEITKVDFRVTCGLRTIQEQRKLLASGATKTLKSKHIEGLAVDLVAMIGSRISWELNLYDDIADAMKQAAIENNLSVRWGGAWTVDDIRKWNGPMQAAMNSYIDARRRQGKRPFIDSPHFEISE